MKISSEVKAMTSFFTVWGLGVGGCAELLDLPSTQCPLRAPLARARERFNKRIMRRQPKEKNNGSV